MSVAAVKGTSRVEPDWRKKFGLKNSRRDESRRLNPMNHQPKMFLAACRLP